MISITTCAAVVNNVLLNRDAALAVATTFVAVTDKLAENIGRLFENGVETDIILYLGPATARAGRHRLTAETGFARIEKLSS